MTSMGRKENTIEICNGISQSLKNQNILMLEKSVVNTNTKEADQLKYLLDVDTVNLNKENKSTYENFLTSKELNFDSNLYLEFCQKPDESIINPHLEICKKPEELLPNENHSSSNLDEIKQTLTLRIFKSQPNILPASLQNGEKNANNSNEEKATDGKKNHSKDIHLTKSTDKDSKKRKYEDEDFDPSIVEECDARRRKTLFSREEEESLTGNPYYEYILKLETSNSDICINGNSAEHNHRNNTFDEEKRKSKKRFENGGDVFGNNFTSKDRNKFKVNCPHCSRKVSAPGYVRHLTYCMKVGIRKRTRKF